MMCNRWKTSSVQYTDCSLNVNYNSLGNFVISGSAGVLGAVFVKYWSSAPPTYSLSFAGSGLPYPNEEIAYEKTPNQGVAQIKDGRFQFAIDSPNSGDFSISMFWIIMTITLICSFVQSSKNS